MDKTVSVVVPHYGDPDPTTALIDQLRPQVESIGEIIVVDDASPVPYPEQPGVTVIRRPRNGGFGSTCNSGAQAASGALLLFLNSDTQVAPTFIGDLIAAAAPWQPCVAGPRIAEAAGMNASARRFPTISQQFVEWLVPLARFHHTRRMSKLLGHDTMVLESETPGVTDWLVGAAILVPRDEFLAVHGFDETYFMNCEEVDLQLRLNKRNIPAVFLPGIVVEHIGGGSSADEKRRFWVASARDLYARKWGHPRTLRAALTTATFVNLAWNSVRRLKNREIRPLSTARLELALIYSGQGSH
ncbi:MULTISPECIES: glycosyltransferase family 2 protein [unclassified Microbacterium]|uniref:glycosyltransferase family 2 protein n=1 Tax=unclassified Microbacterium TaxID=2609290 RepID=UPI001AC5AE41|nr:glycosyltransferase family 2 protein [Microbacterium sp.]MBN9157272.1 glycosyltransferase family 2 protein [Microbacterium sp.]MBS1896456.1 glycosyltransferase family 2 protein [Actinomycetota bacterium]